MNIEYNLRRKLHAVLAAATCVVLMQACDPKPAAENDFNAFAAALLGQERSSGTALTTSAAALAIPTDICNIKVVKPAGGTSIFPGDLIELQMWGKENAVENSGLLGSRVLSIGDLSSDQNNPTTRTIVAPDENTVYELFVWQVNGQKLDPYEKCSVNLEVQAYTEDLVGLLPSCTLRASEAELPGNTSQFTLNWKTENAVVAEVFNRRSFTLSGSELAEGSRDFKAYSGLDYRMKVWNEYGKSTECRAAIKLAGTENTAPFANDVTANIDAGSNKPIQGLLSASDLESDQLTYSIQNPESVKGLTWTAGDTAFTFDPAGYTESQIVTFVYSVQETASGRLISNTATVRINLQILSSWSGIKQFGTTEQDYGRGVSADKVGNSYVVGYTEGNLDGNTNAGGVDAFLVKYNSAGNKEWTRLLGTSASEQGLGVSTDGTGNVYVVGNTSGGLDGNSNLGGNDAFLVKYNSAGDKIWTRQFGTSSNDDASGISTDSAGNIYVVGHTGGGLDGNTNLGGTDAYLVKYDPAGVKLWTRQFGTNSNDVARSVSIDNGDNVYVTGNMGWGRFEVFLAKYDSAGTNLWTQQLEDEERFAYGVSADNAGNIYITGNINQGGNYLFLMKYNAAGEYQWMKMLGTSDDFYGRAVATDVAGNIYVAGHVVGTSFGSNVGIVDPILVKYNSSGARQWTRTFATSTPDYAYGIFVDSLNHIYVAGATSGDLGGNTSSGSWDAFLVKYE